MKLRHKGCGGEVGYFSLGEIVPITYGCLKCDKTWNFLAIPEDIERKVWWVWKQWRMPAVELTNMGKGSVRWPTHYVR